MKKNYQKPAMQVVLLRHQNLLQVNSVTSPEGFTQKRGGFDDSDADV